MNLQKKVIYFLFFYLASLNLNAGITTPGICVVLSCASSPCDIGLTCVMQKQKRSLKARLDDLIHTIEENTKQTKHQTKLIEKEVLAYRRLLERIKKENLSLKEGVFLSKKIRDNESLSQNIDTLEKGK